MPTSSYAQIPIVIYELLTRKPIPSRVLDVGVGFGKWGFLVREYCDIYARRCQPNETGKWMTIDGVEADQSYHLPHHDLLYNKVWWKPIQVAIDEIPTYDAIIMSDVLEHLNEETGLDILAKLRDKTGLLIVTTPDGLQPHSYPGHPLETHLSGWSEESLRFVGADRVEKADGQLIAIWE